MFCFYRPEEHRIRDYLAGQVGQNLSYGSVGCTRDFARAETLPEWTVDRHRVHLGNGADAFQRAKAAIEGWRMFPPEITSVLASEIARPGLNVAVLFDARPLPLWLLMPARVVWVVEEVVTCDSQQIDRFGFAYGTLPDHPECGEERFLVEWDHGDDSVHYDLLAVSQPRHWLARVAFPYTRWQQARFRRLSGLAMQRAVASTTS